MRKKAGRAPTWRELQNRDEKAMSVYDIEKKWIDKHIYTVEKVVTHGLFLLLLAIIAIAIITVYIDFKLST